MSAPQSGATSVKARAVTVTSRYHYDSQTRREYSVPFVRISGKWLADVGVHEGTRLAISSEEGRLVLTIVQHPAKVEPPKVRRARPRAG
jgi:hypothetical protein